MKAINPQYLGNGLVAIRKIGDRYFAGYHDTEVVRGQEASVYSGEGFIIENANTKAFQIVARIANRANRENSNTIFSIIGEEFSKP